MTDWQTYRNGNPREIWNLERLARHRAAKLGYRVHRSWENLEINPMAMSACSTP